MAREWRDGERVLPTAADMRRFEAGTREPAAAVADATDAEDIVAQFNALLASLRAGGYIEEGD